jgi:hypothetical protein
MLVPIMINGVTEQDVVNALDTMPQWARNIIDRFLPAYYNQVAVNMNNLEERLKKEAQRRRACEAELSEAQRSLKRCVNELERARGEIYDLQMRD